MGQDVGVRKPFPLFHHIRVQHTILFEIVRNSVLCEKRCLQLDLCADPFPFRVRRIQRMIATATATELQSEIGALDLVELLNSAPGFVAHGA